MSRFSRPPSSTAETSATNPTGDNMPSVERIEECLPDVGHPATVFIDTSVFESLNFAFGGTLLKALLARIKAGDLRLLISEITRQEVHSRLAVGVNAAKGAIGRFRKEAKILKGLPGHSLSAIFRDPDWVETKKSLSSDWERFIKAAKAQVLPIDGNATAEVFNDYFACKAPFGGGDKKNEFPDAFVIMALQSFAKKQKCKIIVVSHDNDFRSACEGNSMLVWCPDLNKVLEHSARFAPLSPDAIHSLLTQHRTELDAAIVASFQDRGFYWNSDEGHDSDVDETYDWEVESLEIAVIDTTDKSAEVAGNATIHFRASVQYPDPDMTYKDDETKEWFSLGNVDATLAATTEVPVTFRVNIDKLKKGIFEYEDLVVNNNGDVWFSEDEVEETHRPDYHE